MSKFHSNLNILIKIRSSFMFPEMNLSISQDQNLQEKEKEIFKLFSVMKFFKHNTTYYKLVN